MLDYLRHGGKVTTRTCADAATHSNEIGVLALKISKQGEAEIPGLTDTVLSNRLGPKRYVYTSPTRS